MSFLTNELINTELESIGSRRGNRGYRNIRHRLIQKNISYTFNLVRLALKSIDPDGVDETQIEVKTWHIYGIDKLKPFGFCIHAGNDGFSRKILFAKIELY